MAHYRGSNIGVQLIEHTNNRGHGINLNRSCITKVLPNPAVGRDIKTVTRGVKTSAKKSK
jgi:hypothetical protein